MPRPSLGFRDLVKVAERSDERVHPAIPTSMEVGSARAAKMEVGCWLKIARRAKQNNRRRNYYG